jgi:hypothetical protein
VKVRPGAAAALMVLLAGCAAESRARWRAEACTAAVAREEGSKDGAEGKPYSTAFAEPCDPAARPPLVEAYRAGYQQAAEKAGKPGLPGGAAFRCETSPFGEPFVGFGATDRDAREAARRACAARHGERQCEEVTCRVN